MRALLALACLMLAACGGERPASAPVPVGITSGAVQPLGELPRQSLAAGACSAFLWQVADQPRLIAMLQSAPAIARAVIDGRTVDLARASADGTPWRDLAPNARYADAERAIAVELVIEERSGLADGAIVASGSLTLERAGRDSLVVPVSGMIACRR